MVSRMLTRNVVIAAAALAVASTTVLGGQSNPARPDARTLAGTEAVKAFIASRIQKNWTQPKTPWGDPDISGVFTTKNETNTPLERPAEWSGRAIDSITPPELADAIKRRQAGALMRRAPRVVPIHWFDNLAAANSRPWFVVEPVDGKVPPRVAGAPVAPPELTLQDRQVLVGQAGADAVDALVDTNKKDEPEDRTLGDRCIVFTGDPFRLPGIYGNSYEIVQAPGYVVVRDEMVHEARMIPMDGRPLPSSAVRQYLGISRGWWDGNTLVVETSNFSDHARLTHRGASVKNLRAIERFTRISPKQVEWTLTIDDPTVYTRQWTRSLPMTKDDTQPIHEYACHEGNTGMANLLSAGRFIDKQGK